VLFTADMLMMAIWADHSTVVIVGIIASGAFIGNNNTLITEAVMGAAPVERPVASAAYSFVRFCGGAVGPYVALKLFGEAPDVHVHAPFWFGAASVLVGVVVLTAGARTVSRALRTDHDAEAAVGSQDEAEAVLVGDLD
jgi:ACDE family multidrug resistance protein